MTTSTIQEAVRMIDADHAKIDREIDGLHAWSAEVRELGIPRFGEMALRLEKIRDQLQTHFLMEEKTGCLTAAAAEKSDPQEASRLVNEHSELLTELNSLIERFRTCSWDDTCWGAACGDFEAFLGRLRAHERAENELVGSSRTR
jgi:hypothetical protein